MIEDDYSYLKRIEEYAKRRWKEPLVCSYLWDKYGLETKVVNRKDKLCRIDVDYAYDEDFNLQVLLEVNTSSPLLYQDIWCDGTAYNDMGDLEDGHIVLYMNSDNTNSYDKVGELPLYYNIKFKQDFKLVAKYYTLDETTYSDSIDVTDDVNLSDIVEMHIRDYSEADYYVSSDGDDTNDGSLEYPFKTLQHASNTVTIGDTICCLTNLNLDNIVNFNTSCYVMSKDSHTVLSSSSKEYLRVNDGVELYIQGIDFDDTYSYNSGTYIINEGTAPIYIVGE